MFIYAFEKTAAMPSLPKVTQAFKGQAAHASSLEKRLGAKGVNLKPTAGPANVSASKSMSFKI